MSKLKAGETSRDGRLPASCNLCTVAVKIAAGTKVTGNSIRLLQPAIQTVPKSK